MFRTITFLWLEVLALALPMPVLAVTILVDGTSCALADAITAANSDSATGGCIAGSGEDTIKLNTNVTLAAPLPALTSVVTINGNYFQVDGAGEQRVFNVNEAAADVIFKDITIINGSVDSTVAGGGGLHVSAGTVTLSFSYVMNNASGSGGGGLYITGGTVRLYDSFLMSNTSSGAGGGIHITGGTLQIDNSILQENSASGAGGGLYSAGSATITIDGAHFVKNQSTGTSKDGAGLYVNGGSATIKQSTFSYNEASGDGSAIAFDSGALTVENSFIPHNKAVAGGGLQAQGGTIHLKHLTIIHNEATGGANNGAGLNKTGSAVVNMTASVIADSAGADCSGGLSTNAANHIEDNSCSPAHSGALEFVTLTEYDLYIDLPQASPLTNKVPLANCLAVDRIDQSRPNPSFQLCDIGAMEAADPDAVPPPDNPISPTNSPSPSPTATPSPTVPPTATNTLVPPPPTLVIPTDTATPIHSATPAPTNTLVRPPPTTAIPTDTPSPTYTATPTATNTPVVQPPATATPTDTATPTLTPRLPPIRLCRRRQPRQLIQLHRR